MILPLSNRLFCKNPTFNEAYYPSILLVWITPKKADGIAPGFTNVQEPTKFKIGSNPYKNRTPLPLLNPTRNRHSKSERNWRIPLHKFEQRLAEHLEFEPEPVNRPNPKSAELNHGRLCSSNSEFFNRRCGNLWPEGNIQPALLTFFSSLSLRQIKL